MDSESEPIRELSKLPCPDTKDKGCGSSDAFTVYSDGHGHCFSCGDHYSPREVTEAGYDVGVPQSLPSDRPPETNKIGRPTVSEDVKVLIERGTYRNLPGWGISQATCEAFHYRTLIDRHGDKLHLAEYRDDNGQLVDVKVRNTGPEGTGKDFYWASGKAPKGLLYNAHTLGKGGKKVIIAMGEKDCMTVSQLWGNKFPVVSPSNGETSLVKDLAAYLPQLSRYDQVVIVQDMDEPGLRAGQKAARILPPGKAYLVKLPHKDANETLLKGSAEALINAIHNAAPFRPDGIVDADELDGELLIPTKWGLSLPWPFLTNWTKGMRPGEVWVNGAGTGIGKSDWAGEIVQHLIKPKKDGGECVPVAVFNYEAGPVRTLKMLVGKLVDKRFNQPPPEGADGLPNFDGFLYWQPEDMERARVYRREQCAKLYINDHKGAVDWASVKDRLRFLRHEADIQVGFIDPVAALVAQEDNDVKALDRIFAEAKGLAEELQITILFNSHLTRPKDGKSHEEGGRVELRHFRGSGAITMWASYVFGLERDTQSDDVHSDTTLRCLKDREFGDATGYTRHLVYNTLSGRLEESVPVLMEGPEPPPLGVG